MLMSGPQRQPVPPTGAELIGVSVGRYVIRECLGAGGMGEVFRAEDTVLKRTVALKRLAPKLREDDLYRQRLMQEATRASSITSAHVAAVYDVIEHAGETYLVMEFVEGTTLRARLQHHLAPEEFLQIATECADGLIAAHEKGVVHCDLKPDNIMLTRDGRVKVLDFGVAKRLPFTTDANTPTQSLEKSVGSFSGTPAYMAPEVLLEQQPDQRSDIFSLGVVLYECLTRQNPFLTSSLMGTADRILHQDPPPPSPKGPYPPELDGLIAKMLEKDPARRYASARELSADLRALHRLTTDPKIALKLKRRRWWQNTAQMALAAVALLAVTFALWLLVAQRGAPSPTPPAIPAQKHIAVLPFRAIGDAPQGQQYCEGLTETLTAKLTQLTTAHQLQVAPASDARLVRSAEQARQELGVNLVLEGSLFQAGDSVRVTFSLVDAESRRQLDGETITVAAADPFALQDRVVESVVRMLELQVNPDERQSLAAHGTSVPAAHQLFLIARGYLQNYDRPENVDGAIDLLKQATALDQRYPQAWASLGEAYWRQFEGTNRPQLLDAARNACAQSLQLDPALAAGHVCLGTLSNKTGQYEQAAAEFRKALASEPTNDAAYRGLALSYQRLGRLDEAEKTFHEAIRMRPRYWAVYNWAGWFYFSQARYGEAARMFTEVVRLVPDSPRGYYNLAGVHLSEGRYTDAIPLLERSISIRPTAANYSNLGVAYFFLRRFPEAARAYEQATQLNERDYEVWGNLGEAHYWTGDRAASRRAYERAIALANDALKVNPRDAALHALLANYHAFLAQKPEALGHLRTALKIAPADPEVLYTAALVHTHSGDRGAALSYLEKAFAAGVRPSRVRDNPLFDELRKDPRYADAAKKAS